VARQFRLDLLGEGGSAGFDVAQPPVEWRQLRAQAYDAYVHRVATGGARIIFRFIYQMLAQAAMLARWGHRQQPEIGSLAAQLNHHASRDPGWIFGQKKIALFQHWLQGLGTDAVALDEKTLRGAEGHIDHTHDGRDVARFRPASFYCAVHPSPVAIYCHPGDIMRNVAHGRIFAGSCESVGCAPAPLG